jgi:toxin HigB-1
MILSFHHKGLKLIYEKGDRRRVAPELVAKIEWVLTRLDEAMESANIDLPGFRLHLLKGKLARIWVGQRLG